MKKAGFILLLLILTHYTYAQQETVVSGKIIDKTSKDALPFVSVGFKGTKIGTTSNFEGNFTLHTSMDVDSIIVSYVGYKTVRKKIKRGQKNYLTIEMSENTNDLLEVIIKPGENPALRIIRKAQENRDINDQRNLAAYEYDSYNKMDLSLNNISEKMKERKMFKPLKSLFDTINQIKNEEGKYILPIFISETFSRYHYLANPSKTKEIVKASSSTGIGVSEKSYVSDLLGTSFIQFNFNQNWLRILGKDFISPIAFGSNTYYIYTLQDSVEIDGLKCYKIKLNLRREEDLGFLGTMWISDSTFAIKRINVEISPSANINFIDRLKIQQEMQQMSSGQWLPSKTRLVIDIAQFTENSSGLIAKMYTVNSNFAINQAKPDGFYEDLIDKEEDVYDKDSVFWNSKRPEAFSDVEKQMFRMVDSVKTLPVIKTYVDIIRLVVDGYHRIGGFDWGPYVFLYGWNNVEGSRFRIGFRTNHFFHKQWVLRAYTAYGIKDERFKYSLGADYIFSKKKWTSLGVSYKYDYDLLGVTDIQGGVSNLFAAINIGSSLSRLNETKEWRLHFITAPKRDWTFRAILQTNYFRPLGNFVFAYQIDPEKNVTTDNTFSTYNNTQLMLEARYAYKEVMVARGNERARIVRAKAPILAFQYTRGFNGLLNGQFDYDRVSLNISQHVTTGVFGNADYSITLGKVYGVLPYTLLDIPRGNQTFLYSDFNFSLLNLYEFVSDEYLQASYVQHFEGLFFNRIPLLKKLKWRNFGVIKTAFGHLSDENFKHIPATDAFGNTLSTIHRFNNKPYLEAGFGIENILHLFSVSYMHRFTYRNLPDVRTWGINLGVRIEF